jgi:hypothetical protein
MKLLNINTIKKIEKLITVGQVEIIGSCTDQEVSFTLADTILNGAGLDRDKFEIDFKPNNDQPISILLSRWA